MNELEQLKKENSELRIALSASAQKGAEMSLLALLNNVKSIIREASDDKEFLMSLLFMERMIEEYANKLRREK